MHINIKLVPFPGVDFRTCRPEVPNVAYEASMPLREGAVKWVIDQLAAHQNS